jgi:hypothetical protein
MSTAHFADQVMAFLKANPGEQTLDSITLGTGIERRSVSAALYALMDSHDIRCVGKHRYTLTSRHTCDSSVYQTLIGMLPRAAPQARLVALCDTTHNRAALQPPMATNGLSSLASLF